MQPIGRVAARVQVLIKFVHHHFGGAKNDPVAEVVEVDQAREHVDLVAAIHLEIHLIDFRCVLGLRSDFHPFRIR